MRYDFVISGGGIVGMSIAREIKSRWADATILVLEKEMDSTSHASGRNSGVIHAGFYYSPDSIKAKLTRDGNVQLKEFCRQKGIPTRECGKVVVTKNELELERLLELFRRGQKNGVDLELITESELKRIEPQAKTVSAALWSPSTAVADPSVVTNAIAADAVVKGVEVSYGERYLSMNDDVLYTTKRSLRATHFINASGLFADRVAQQFGFGSNYVMIPFIGLYSYAPALKDRFQRHVYPVPDPRNPFLGVHLTVTMSGIPKVGPTAIPALSREAYRALRDVNARDFRQIVGSLWSLARSPHHNFFSLLTAELPKYSRSWLVREASRLIPGLNRSDFSEVGKPGIRAQLFDIEERRLEMDFVVRGDSSSTHILNAVSPAWTSSLAFANYVVEDIAQRLK
jgi:L-2-hydroxyglutarate oxidase